MLGLAAQSGFLPIEISSIEKAIELNGVAINQNITAFKWGRLLAESPKEVFQTAGLLEENQKKETIQSYVDNFYKVLELYQDKVYANKYNDIVSKVFEKETKLFKDKTEVPLTRKVALTLFRLMRYKDEYEVARLHTSGDFAKQFLSSNKDAKLEYYLAPPLFSKIDKNTGHLQKRRFGSWMFKAFKILSGLKFLRGTRFDLFGYTAERKSERALVKKTINTIIAVTKNLDFAINLIELSGDREFNNFLKSRITRYENDKDINKKNYELILKTQYRKNIKSKDAAGLAENYELVITVDALVKSDSIQTKKLVFEEKFNMKRFDDAFEEKNYEKTVKENFSDIILERIIFYLFKL